MSFHKKAPTKVGIKLTESSTFFFQSLQRPPALLKAISRETIKLLPCRSVAGGSAQLQKEQRKNYYLKKREDRESTGSLLLLSGSQEMHTRAREVAFTLASQPASGGARVSLCECRGGPFIREVGAISRGPQLNTAL